jgi:hypothetical protein
MRYLSTFTLLVFTAFLWNCSTETKGTDDQSTAVPLATTDSIKGDTASETPHPLSMDLDTAHFERLDGTLKLTWKMLSDVVFTDEYSEEVQAYVPYPTFGAQLGAIEGREVLVEGYVIPLEETGDETILVLSAQPYSSCFFCGGAGPESVMDIKLRPGTNQKFTTDDRITFRGRLRLNDDDLYFLNYILEDAEVHQ